MANIALQDGKVVLKDGKVSCTCCDVVCECPDNPSSPFIPPIAGEFKIDGSWSSTVGRDPYSTCGRAISGLADGTTLTLSWRCFGAWYIFSFNFDPSLPNNCQNQFAAVFSASPVGTFPLFPSEPGCEDRYVTISSVV
jgi:hypothetical protein